jgi:DNA polymerase III sliding clamp (beta) subunit (PCNA family)
MSPEASMIIQIALKSGVETAQFTVNAEALYSALRNLTGDRVSLKQFNNTLVIKWDKGTIRLPTYTTIFDYKEPESVEGFVQMTSAYLGKLISDVSYTHPDDGDEPYTEVLHIARYRDELVHLAYSNPRLLTLRVVSIPVDAVVNKYNMSIFAAKVIKKVCSILTTHNVYWTTTSKDLQMRFVDDTTSNPSTTSTPRELTVSYYALGVSIPYPLYVHAIPTSGYRYVEIQRDVLLEALRRVCSLAHMPTIMLGTTEDNFVIRLIEERGISSEEVLPYTNATWRPTDLAKLNADMLKQAVEQLSKDSIVRIKLFDSGKPLVISNNNNSDYIQVVTQRR